MASQNNAVSVAAGELELFGAAAEQANNSGLPAEFNVRGGGSEFSALEG